MRKYIVLYSFLVLCLPVYANWPMFHQGPRHTGKTNILAAQTDSLKWTLDLGIEISPFGGPSVSSWEDEEYIFLGTANGVYVLNSDGDIAYILCEGESVEIVPAVSGNMVYFSTGDSLRAFSIGSGYSWSAYIGANATHPTLFEERIYIAGGDRLRCFTLDGDSLWATERLGGGIDKAAPAVDEDGNIYVATLGSSLSWYDYRIYAFNPNGTERWVFESFTLEPGGIRVSPVVDEDKNIYVATCYEAYWPSSIYSIKDAAQNWRSNAEVMYSSVAFDENHLYYGTRHGLTCRDIDGNLLWQYSTASPISYSAPAIGGDGTIYTATDAGLVIALDNEGNLKWSYDTHRGRLTSPAIGEDGVVYLASEDGIVFAFVGLDVGVRENTKDKNHFSVQPNPVKEHALLNYQLLVPAWVKITLVDLSGRPLKNLAEGYQGSGEYQVQFSSKEISSGIYFIWFETHERTETKKIVVIK